MCSFEGRAVGQGKNVMLTVIFLPGGLFLTQKLERLAGFNWFPRNWRFYNGMLRVVTLLYGLGCDSLWLFMAMNNELCL